MARSRTAFVCSSCGFRAPKWLGRCPECQEWNSLSEVAQEAPPSAATTARPVPLSEVQHQQGGELRVRTGLAVLDEVLGGGLVAGSLVLVGGDPGVGKSTLLLMAVGRFAQRGLPVLYASGEESVQQVASRAERLGVSRHDDIRLLATTDFQAIENATRSLRPAVLVVDSVQTVGVPELTNLPGSVPQVREVAHRTMRLAKGGRTAVILVGHVTKSGDLAGPKVLEHFVDTVLHFEGDGSSGLRALRSVKNRFGPAGALGLFEMVEAGLREVPDASARLLQERAEGAAGTAVVAAVEGNRPMLCEVQALVGRSGAATPARTCVGVDRTRVLMLSAVLEKHGLALYDRDLFVNAAGGVRLMEPAADLAVLAAISSSLHNRPVPSHTLLFGEVGLVGEVRAVPAPMPRLAEAARHGFRRVIAPRGAALEIPPGLELIPVRSVRQVLEAL